MVDICEISPSTASRLGDSVVSKARPATSGHLSFAAGLAQSTTYDEAESRLSRIFPDQGRQEYGLEGVILEMRERQDRPSG